jgi:aldose 1-epimerase
MFELEHGRQRLVVAELGAALQSWTVAGHELLDAHDGSATAFAGQVLAPWPNRIRDGRYDFDGVEHRVALTEAERGNALHGLATGRRWRAARSSTRHLTLVCDLHPAAGYPFALRLSAAYELTADGVAITLRADNVGTERAPFGTGIHPYVTLGGGRIDDELLELPARLRLPLDDRLLPAGSAVPVERSEVDFRAGRPIGGLRLDACFTELARSDAGVAHVRLVSATGGRRVTLWMDEHFRYVQVYTGDGVPDPARRRRSIAIEPMTCAPDAFNSGAGLLVLEPGAAFTGRCGLSAAGFA